MKIIERGINGVQLKIFFNLKNQLQFYQLTIAVSVSNLHELVNNSTPISKYNSNKSRISKFSICQEAGGGGGGSQDVTVSMFTLEPRLVVVGVTVRSVVVVVCVLCCRCGDIV